MPTLESKWHELPCGALLSVSNNQGWAITIRGVINPITGAPPPSDSVALKESSDLLGYQVELAGPWICDITGLYKTVEIRRKLVLDEPESF